MSWQVEILPRALKALGRIPEPGHSALRKAMVSLAEQPRPAGCKKLSGREGWRLRCGDYRIVYEIADKVRIVTVLDVGHRRDIYR